MNGRRPDFGAAPPMSGADVVTASLRARHCWGPLRSRRRAIRSAGCRIQSRSHCICSASGATCGALPLATRRLNSASHHKQRLPADRLGPGPDTRAQRLNRRMREGSATTTFLWERNGGAADLGRTRRPAWWALPVETVTAHQPAMRFAGWPRNVLRRKRLRTRPMGERRARRALPR